MRLPVAMETDGQLSHAAIFITAGALPTPPEKCQYLHHPWTGAPRASQAASPAGSSMVVTHLRNEEGKVLMW
jgi:hypothetical protein